MSINTRVVVDYKADCDDSQKLMAAVYALTDRVPDSYKAQAVENEKEIRALLAKVCQTAFDEGRKYKSPVQ